MIWVEIEPRRRHRDANAGPWTRDFERHRDRAPRLEAHLELDAGSHGAVARYTEQPQRVTAGCEVDFCSPLRGEVKRVGAVDRERIAIRVGIVALGWT